MKLKKFNFYLPLTTLLLVILGVFLLIKADFDTRIYLFVATGIFFLCGCLYLIAFVIDKRAHYRPGWILPAGITFLISTLFIVLSIINGTEPINSLLMASGIALSVQASAESSVQTASQDYVQEVVSLINQERTAQGLNPLQNDSALNQSAEIRSQELITNFSHTRPDGRNCSTVLNDNGITWRTTGENIAYGYPDAESVMNGWMNSSGHRANILNDSFD